jgi:diguanylate cyclase (GGDEF)-like protein/PAS domain S-box-containing protein
MKFHNAKYEQGRIRTPSSPDLPYQHFFTLFMAAQDAILILNDRRRIMMANTQSEKMFGFEPGEMANMEVEGVVPTLFANDGADQGEKYAQEVVQPSLESDFIGVRKDKSAFVAEVGLSELGPSDNHVTMVILRDVTDRIALQSRLLQQATHDALTGLPNRVLFRDRSEQAIADARRNKSQLALLFLDLDHFKNLNDTLGHDRGDMLLQLVAGRLEQSLRANDTVARQGGDEFTILLRDIRNAPDVLKVTNKILASFAKPFSVMGEEIYVSVSIGVALYPFHDTKIGALLKYADIAMYRAKQMGRNNFQFYNAGMNSTVHARVSTETQLRHALSRNELAVHYQAQLNPYSNEITGMEALIRWEHPALGTIQPSTFIPIAEEAGLIVPIGEWVLRTACEQTRRWQENGRPDIRVSVNVSAVQFRQDGFARKVAKILRDTGLKPSSLELEITEGVMMRDIEATIRVLNSLNEMGIHISIDDFGTGYSSLSYLKQFPIKTLKIDKSFVNGISSDESDDAIVKATIALAHSLGIAVVAEGVETAEQNAFLMRHGCDKIQGYYISRPVPAQEFENLLNRTQMTLMT